LQIESASQGGDPTLWGALQKAMQDPRALSGATARKLAGFAELIARLGREQPRLMLSEIYHLILDETAYVQELKKEGTEEALSRIENLEEFDALLREFE